MDPLFDLLKGELRCEDTEIKKFKVEKKRGSTEENSKEKKTKVPKTCFRNKVRLGSEKHRNTILKRIIHFFNYCSNKWLKNQSNLQGSCSESSTEHISEQLLAHSINNNNFLQQFIQKKYTIDEETAENLFEAFRFSKEYLNKEQIIPHIMILLKKFHSEIIDVKLENLEPVPFGKLMDSNRMDEPEMDSIFKDISMISERFTETEFVDYSSEDIQYKTGRTYVSANDNFHHLTITRSKHQKLKSDVTILVRQVGNKIGIKEEYEFEEIMDLLSSYALSSKSVRNLALIAACAYIVIRRKGLHKSIAQIAAKLSLNYQKVAAYILKICLIIGIEKYSAISLEKYVQLTVNYIIQLKIIEGKPTAKNLSIIETVQSNEEKIILSEKNDENFENFLDELFTEHQNTIKINYSKQKKNVTDQIKAQIIELIQKIVKAIYSQNPKFSIQQKQLDLMQIESVPSHWVYNVSVAIYIAATYMKWNLTSSDIINYMELKSSTFYYFRKTVIEILKSTLVKKGLLSNKFKVNILTITCIIDENDLALFSN